jgi:hypothetical protein
MPPGEGFRPGSVEGFVEIVEHGMGIPPVIHQPVDPLIGSRTSDRSGNTVTVSVVPWTNPMQSDTYLFQVVAYPAGPEPLGSPVGVATLRIYENTYW